VLSKTGVKALKNLKTESTIVFQKYKYEFLFGKKKPTYKKTLIQVMNRDLKHTCGSCNLPYNIKSHSFRVNVISNLLKITTVQNTADIIGHQDIRSTMAYRRYALSKDKEEINDLLEKITDNETQN
jgi:integrase